MTQLPQTLDEAIAQAREATKAALNEGYRLIQVEIVLPEITLQAQYVAEQFIPALQELGGQLKVFFPDTGAAALARRDWGEVPFKISDLGSSRSPIDRNIQPEDELFLVVNASDVEVAQVERLYNLAGDRPVILLIPNLENAAVVGIGYAGRQLRERFLTKIETCYYLRPLEGAAVTRFYPQPWQVWLKQENDFPVIAELPSKPSAETLEQILIKALGGEENSETPVSTPPRRGGFLGELQRVFRALSQ